MWQIPTTIPVFCATVSIVWQQSERTTSCTYAAGHSLYWSLSSDSQPSLNLKDFQLGYYLLYTVWSILSWFSQQPVKSDVGMLPKLLILPLQNLFILSTLLWDLSKPVVQQQVNNSVWRQHARQAYVGSTASVMEFLEATVYRFFPKRYFSINCTYLLKCMTNFNVCNVTNSSSHGRKCHPCSWT
jgi:hypothetical protein